MGVIIAQTNNNDKRTKNRQNSNDNINNQLHYFNVCDCRQTYLKPYRL